MDKSELINELSKELWEKSSWRFGTALEEEYHNIFDDIAKDTVELLIEKDLLKDVEPFMKHWLIATTNEYSDKLQSHLIKAPSESAAVYELCHNHIGKGMRIVNIQQIEEKTFSAIKEYEYKE
jgi:hypothetical protein